MYEQGPNLEARRQKRLKRRRIIRITALGIACLVILFLCLYQFTDIMFGLSEDLESSSGPGEWAMFRRDLSHTGSINPGAILPRGEVKWTFTTGAAIHSSPTVVDGVLYFGSQDFRVYALDAATGDKLWEFKTGSWVESSPAVVDGVVYVGSNDGNVYALDADTGNELWHFKTAYAVRSSPAVANGMVCFGSDDWNIYAVDAATGTELWHYGVDNMVISSPAITQGVVVVGSVDGHCYVLNAINGKMRLQFPSRSVTASPAVKDSVAYFSNNMGSLYAIDVGARNWPLENKLKVYWDALYIRGAAPRPPKTSGYVWSTWLMSRTSSSPALEGDNLYIGAGTRMVSINTVTHEIQWQFEVGETVASSPAVAGNAVYFGSEDGRLYALDRTTGEKLWDSPTGDIITSSPAVAGGMVYVGSHDGILYAFE